MEGLRLSVEECTRRNSNNLWYVCTVWAKNYFLQDCQVRPGKLQCLGFVREVILGEDSSSQCLHVLATMISLLGPSFVVLTLVDSGSGKKFIHSSLKEKHHLPVTHLKKPLSISSINREVLAGSSIAQYHWLYRSEHCIGKKSSSTFCWSPLVLCY